MLARNVEIIKALQTQEVEERLFARPGVYDGRKNLFTSFDLEFESGFHEASQSYRHLFSYSTFSPYLTVCSPYR